MGKKSIYDERAGLIDAHFLGELSVEGARRLTEIEAELDALDVPKVALELQRQEAKFAEIDRRINKLKAEIKMKKVPRVVRKQKPPVLTDYRKYSPTCDSILRDVARIVICRKAIADRATIRLSPLPSSTPLHASN